MWWDLVEFKVSYVIEVLVFIVEGYNCVKSILKKKFGKDFEIVKVYIKEMLDLLMVVCVNFNKINDFSEKLIYSV